MKTFDEWASDYTLTDYERTELVWRLAQYRMRKTLKALLPTSNNRAKDQNDD